MSLGRTTKKQKRTPTSPSLKEDSGEKSVGLGSSTSLRVKKNSVLKRKKRLGPFLSQEGRVGNGGFFAQNRQKPKKKWVKMISWWVPVLGYSATPSAERLQDF